MNLIIERIRNGVISQILNLMIVPVIMLSTLILVVKPFAAAILLFAGVAFLVLAFYPTMGIYSIFLSHPFDSLTRLTINNPLTLTKGIIMILLSALVIRALLSKDPLPLMKLFNNRLTITAYLFLLISVVSVINAIDYKLFTFQIVRRISFVLFLLLIINLIKDSRIFKKVLVTMFIAYVIVACMGVYELVTGNSIAVMRWGDDIKKSIFATGTAMLKVNAEETPDAASGSMDFRLFGLEGSPNFQAFAMIFPATLSLLFFSICKSRLIRIVMIGAFALFVINILGTVTRGGVIALFISVVIFLAVIKMRWKLLIASVALTVFLFFLIAVIYVAPPALYKRLTLQKGAQTVSYRSGLTKMSLAMIKDHPFAGIGVGNFIPVSNHYFIPEVPHATPIIVHNCFLQAWVESGILGFLIYLALYIFAARNIYIVFRETDDNFLKVTASALLAALGGYFFYANIDPFMENEKYWILFAFSVVIFNLHQANKRNNIRLQEA